MTDILVNFWQYEPVRVWRRGLVDSISIHRSIPFVVRSQLIRQRMLQCFLLNGIIFVGSILLYSNVISPLLSFLLKTDVLQQLLYAPETTSSAIYTPDAGGIAPFQAGSTTTGESRFLENTESSGAINNIIGEQATLRNGLLAQESELPPGSASAQHDNLLSGASTDQESAARRAALDASSSASGATTGILVQHDTLILTLFSVLYKLLWLYPIYCISFILNTVAYQDIADCCQLETADEKKNPSLQQRIVDEAFRVLLNLIYILCSTLMYYCIPFGVGKFFYFVASCWLASLYCFEYRWVFLGWNSHQRLSYFESHWLYFCGFGFPIAFLSYTSPTFIDNGIFALIFPFFILTSSVASPQGLPVRTYRANEGVLAAAGGRSSGGTTRSTEIMTNKHTTTTNNGDATNYASTRSRGSRTTTSAGFSTAAGGSISSTPTSSAGSSGAAQTVGGATAASQQQQQMNTSVNHNNYKVHRIPIFWLVAKLTTFLLSYCERRRADPAGGGGGGSNHSQSNGSSGVSSSRGDHRKSRMSGGNAEQSTTRSKHHGSSSKTNLMNRTR